MDFITDIYQIKRITIMSVNKAFILGRGAVEGRTGAHLNKGKKKEPVQEPAADMSPDDVPEVVETEDERYTRLRK